MVVWVRKGTFSDARAAAKFGQPSPAANTPATPDPPIHATMATLSSPGFLLDERGGLLRNYNKQYNHAYDASRREPEPMLARNATLFHHIRQAFDDHGPYFPEADDANPHHPGYFPLKFAEPDLHALIRNRAQQQIGADGSIHYKMDGYHEPMTHDEMLNAPIKHGLWQMRLPVFTPTSPESHPDADVLRFVDPNHKRLVSGKYNGSEKPTYLSPPFVSRAGEEMTRTPLHEWMNQHGAQYPPQYSGHHHVMIHSPHDLHPSQMMTGQEVLDHLPPDNFSWHDYLRTADHLGRKRWGTGLDLETLMGRLRQHPHDLDAEAAQYESQDRPGYRDEGGNWQPGGRMDGFTRKSHRIYLSKGTFSDARAAAKFGNQPVPPTPPPAPHMPPAPGTEQPSTPSTAIALHRDLYADPRSSIPSEDFTGSHLGSALASNMYDMARSGGHLDLPVRAWEPGYPIVHSNLRDARYALLSPDQVAQTRMKDTTDYGTSRPYADYIREHGAVNPVDAFAHGWHEIQGHFPLDPAQVIHGRDIIRNLGQDYTMRDYHTALHNTMMDRWGESHVPLEQLESFNRRDPEDLANWGAVYENAERPGYKNAEGQWTSGSPYDEMRRSDGFKSRCERIYLAKGAASDARSAAKFGRSPGAAPADPHADNPVRHVGMIINPYNGVERYAFAPALEHHYIPVNTGDGSGMERVAQASEQIGGIPTHFPDTSENRWNGYHNRRVASVPAAAEAVKEAQASADYSLPPQERVRSEAQRYTKPLDPKVDTIPRDNLVNQVFHVMRENDLDHHTATRTHWLGGGGTDQSSLRDYLSEHGDLDPVHVAGKGVTRTEANERSLYPHDDLIFPHRDILPHIPEHYSRKQYYEQLDRVLRERYNYHDFPLEEIAGMARRPVSDLEEQAHAYRNRREPGYQDADGKWQPGTAMGGFLPPDNQQKSHRIYLRKTMVQAPPRHVTVRPGTYGRRFLRIDDQGGWTPKPHPAMVDDFLEKGRDAITDALALFLAERALFAADPHLMERVQQYGEAAILAAGTDAVLTDRKRAEKIFAIAGGRHLLAAHLLGAYAWKDAARAMTERLGEPERYNELIEHARPRGGLPMYDDSVRTLSEYASRNEL